MAETSQPHQLQQETTSRNRQHDHGDDKEDRSCGIFGWRPQWLQRFATPNTFFAIVCACLMVEVASHTGYVGAVLSTIEKNFQVRKLAK